MSRISEPSMLSAGPLRPILVKAEAKDLPVRLECLKWNPALAFYRRHGFIITGENDIHFLMERPPRSDGTHE
jgi:hypothetical protein